MRHLEADRLAALADEIATPEEAEHLAVCALCAREVDAYRGLRSAGARSGGVMLDAPLTSWDALAPALRAAGIVREAGGGAGRGGIASPKLRPWLLAAATVVIAVGGVLVGRVTAPTASTGVRSITPSTVVASGVQPAALTTSAGTTIVSVEEALRVMERSERDYRAAMAFIAAQDTASRGDVERYRMRLAALDKVQDAVRQAVQENPEDPMLNQYLLSTRSARAVTLQQLGTTLPSGVRLASY